MNACGLIVRVFAESALRMRLRMRNEWRLIMIVKCFVNMTVLFIEGYVVESIENAQ